VRCGRRACIRAGNRVGVRVGARAWTLRGRGWALTLRLRERCVGAVRALARLLARTPRTRGPSRE
jgi:hypothetical protein